MRALTLFSGVGGLDRGLELAGIEIAGSCEIDPQARAVLAHHWPDVPIHDDVTTLDGRLWNGRVDLVAGGSPCQDLSVAGRRAGLDGERSGLFWHQCRIAAQSGARWVLWENVAGALSSNGGHDFASVLWGLTGCRPDVPADGWRSAGVCVGPDRTAVWRLLDARWFGVAQRRRRVFVVAGPRDVCGPSVLLEPESCPRDSRPSDQAGQDIAGTLGGGSGRRGWAPDTDRMTFVPTVSFGWSNAAGQGDEVEYDPCSPLRSAGERVRGGKAVAVIGTLTTRCGPTFDDQQVAQLVPVAFSENQRGEVLETEYAHQLSTSGGKPGQGYPAARIGTQVRRLTPRECERLMGWPDDWTRWGAGGREMPDSARYRMCGNGVVSPVAEWIGRRIVAADVMAVAA